MSAEVRAARIEADTARARLMLSVEDAKVRLNPGTIASNAAEDAKAKALALAETGVETVRQRPAAVAGVAAGLVAWFARKRIWRLVRGDRDETAQVPTSLNS